MQILVIADPKAAEAMGKVKTLLGFLSLAISAGLSAGAEKIEFPVRGAVLAAPYSPNSYHGAPSHKKLRRDIEDEDGRHDADDIRLDMVASEPGADLATNQDCKRQRPIGQSE